MTIHRFLTEDTVESRILQLQTKKLELANNVLTGAKRTAANKLTFDDLKMLFDLQKWTKKKINSWNFRHSEAYNLFELVFSKLAIHPAKM